MPLEARTPSNFGNLGALIFCSMLLIYSFQQIFSFFDPNLGFPRFEYNPKMRTCQSFFENNFFIFENSNVLSIRIQHYMQKSYANIKFLEKKFQFETIFLYLRLFLLHFEANETIMKTHRNGGEDMHEENTYKRFGSMISKMRIELGYSQEEVSKRLGIPKSTYGNYERGERKIPLPELMKLSKFYGFSIDDFINEEKEIKWTDTLSRLWKDAFENTEFTYDEMVEIIEYAKYILTKRNESK